MKIVMLVALLVVTVSTPSQLMGQTSTQSKDPRADVLRQAHDLPARFEPKKEEWDTGTSSSRSCPTAYADPRDGTTLKFVRSWSVRLTVADGATTVTRETSYGDYWIETTNRYQLQLGEALRIACVSGTALGVVPRFPRNAEIGEALNKVLRPEPLEPA